MTKEQILQVNWQRCEAWALDLAEAHATPALLISIGHDHTAGRVHICVPEDLPMPVIIGLIKKAARDLETQHAQSLRKKS